MTPPPGETGGGGGATGGVTGGGGGGATGGVPPVGGGVVSGGTVVVGVSVVSVGSVSVGSSSGSVSVGVVSVVGLGGGRLRARVGVAAVDRLAAQLVGALAQRADELGIGRPRQLVDGLVDMPQLAVDVVTAAVVDRLAHIGDLALELARAGRRDPALRAAAAARGEQGGAHAEQQSEDEGKGAAHAH